MTQARRTGALWDAEDPCKKFPWGSMSRCGLSPRGERPVQDVDSLEPEFSGSRFWKFYQDPSKPSIPCVLVSWQDLADGFLHHYGDQDALEEWASFVLTDYCEFPEERGDDVERFLESLHDAAGGGSPPPIVHELALRLSAKSLD